MKTPKKERKKFRITTLTALMLRFGIIVFILIYGGLAILTIHAANEVKKQWTDYFYSHTGNLDYFDTENIPVLTPVDMVNQSWSYNQGGYVIYEFPELSDFLTGTYTNCSCKNQCNHHDIESSLYFDTAMVFHGAGQRPDISNTTHKKIEYMTEDTWAKCTFKADGEVVLAPDGIDWDEIFPDVRKIQGYYEYGLFVPVHVSYFDENNTQYFLLNIAERDQLGLITWTTILDNTANCDRELETLYTTTRVDHSKPKSLGAVKVNGIKYASVQEAAREEGMGTCRKHGLWETVLVEHSFYKDDAGYQQTQTTVLRCYPLGMAMHSLKRAYWIVTMIYVGILILYYIPLRRHLLDPVERILTASEGFKALNWERYSPWREIYQLEQSYGKTQQTIHDLRQENQQLRTALEYAQEAEIRRRELVSGITHDLKTPLAIIHSYAEGLDAHIAPEKQTEYLQTILSETERMDAMVLEMLDFSRLEAGKVTLATDQFSLLALTKRVFERLNLQLAEKNLKVHYDITDDFLTTADEARIEQVVTNFATNAIKFSPEGGEIHLNIFQHTGKTMFTIANECENLPEETLERIWDSFYRADSSRTVKGTGLGLPIARAVIHLHQGTCEARNTSTGIEFRFTFPA